MNSGEDLNLIIPKEVRPRNVTHMIVVTVIHPPPLTATQSLAEVLHPLVNLGTAHFVPIVISQAMKKTSSTNKKQIYLPNITQFSSSDLRASHLVMSQTG